MEQLRLRPRARERGFTLIELLVVVAIIGIAFAAALPVYREAIMKAHRRALVADCKGLYQAMMAYHADHSAFPTESGGPTALNLTTLAPLSTEGYFSSAPAFLGKLEGDRVQLYLAPDIGTADSEFVAVMRSDIDPGIVAVVAHTGIITSANQFLDGVYLISEGDLQDATELN